MAMRDRAVADVVAELDEREGICRPLKTRSGEAVNGPDGGERISRLGMRCGRINKIEEKSDREQAVRLSPELPGKNLS